MLTFRRSRRAAAEPTGAPAWAGQSGCSEFQAMGLELELLDAQERRDQVRRGGVGDLAEIEAEIARLQDDLARVQAEPLAHHHIDAA